MAFAAIDGEETPTMFEPPRAAPCGASTDSADLSNLHDDGFGPLVQRGGSGQGHFDICAPVMVT